MSDLESVLNDATADADERARTGPAQQVGHPAGDPTAAAAATPAHAAATAALGRSAPARQRAPAPAARREAAAAPGVEAVNIGRPTHDGRAIPPIGPSGRSARSIAVLSLQARALQHERLADAASAVVDELTRMLKAQRVCLGVLHGSRCKVVAMSHTDDVAERQRLVRIIGAAMDEAILQRSAVGLPALPGHRAMATRAHRSLAELNGRVPMLTMPLFDAGQGEAAAPFGALLVESVHGVDAEMLAAVEDVATFVGPVLALKQRLDQPVSGRLIDAVKPRTGPAASVRRRWLVTAAVVAVLATVLWPRTFRVVAPARVEGQGQQVLAAPFDGFVHAAPLRPGAPVRAGQLLLQLDDRDLVLEQARWQAEAAQLDKAYREAQTTADAAGVVVARARLDQARAQLALATEQLTRTRLVAPFDGILLSGDFSQRIGAPVARGDALLTLVPDHLWHVVAEVDEQDIARVRVQQLGRMLVGALDGAAVDLEVSRVAPVATVSDSRNIFEVDARLLTPPEALKPGLRGVVQLDVDTRMQGWIWWHAARNWLRRTLWRLWA